MPQKFDIRLRQELLSEQREAALHPEALLRRLGLRSGQTMADIGCGPGFFTIPAAEIVGDDGLILAADIQGEMLSAVRSRAAEHGLTSVHVVKTSDKEIPIPDASCDMVLMAFVLNEVEKRSSFLHRAARLLKPLGRLVVLEWVKEQQPDGPPLIDRISPEELLADASAAGLYLDEQRELNDQQYICVFTRTKR
ncbi:MAG: class I SAM-dependent methyltransferase [Ktedonobacterales bacterium]